jgi:hypothetical protein
VEADVEDIPVSEHTVDGELDQQRGLPHAGMGEHGSEPSGGENVL